MQRIYKLPLVLEPQPEGGWTITCPLIPELITEADTLEEIAINVADAMIVVREIYEDEERTLPTVLQPLDSTLPMLIDIPILQATE